MKKTSVLPIAARKAIHKLGSDIKEARIKRRITIVLMAERAGITPVTLAKAEKGDATVSMGIYAKILFVLGLIERLYNLADADVDEVGKTLQLEQLPKRVRYSSKNSGD